MVYMETDNTVRNNLVDHLPHIRKIVQRISKSGKDIDDITQECCARIIEKEELWSGNKKTLLQWMNAVTRNMVFEKLRLKKKEKSLGQQTLIEESVVTAEEEHYPEDEIKWVLKVVKNLLI